MLPPKEKFKFPAIAGSQLATMMSPEMSFSTPSLQADLLKFST